MTRRVLVILIVTFCATEALACGVCVMAAFDSVLPPILLWMLLSTTWFISNGVFRSVTGASLPLQPGALGAIALAFLGLIIGAAMLGPLTVLPLAIPPAYAFIRSLIRRRDGETPLRVIGFVHLAAVAVTLVFTVHTLHTRTDAQFITRWSGSAIARKKFANLRATEPASLKTYREIVVSENAYMAGEAAERIGEIGQPPVDIPLLERALAKFSNNSEARAKIDAALLRLRTRASRVS